MNRIEIDELNYQDYQHLDIVAYSFARGGAMGDPGGIKIVDSDGQVYHPITVTADTPSKANTSKPSSPSLRIRELA
jgi:hypothetical protein